MTRSSACLPPRRSPRSRPASGPAGEQLLTSHIDDQGETDTWQLRSRRRSRTARRSAARWFWPPTTRSCCSGATPTPGDAPRERLLTHYDTHLGARRLNIGPGTGWYPLRRELLRQSVVGLPLRLRASVRDPADDSFLARPDHPRRDQVFTRQPKQQASVIRAPSPAPTGTHPAPSTPSHRPTANPHTAPPAADARYAFAHVYIQTNLRCIDVQLTRQPGYRHRRRRRHLVRHEPQLRQGAQRHRQAKTDRRAPATESNERHIRRGQHEVPEQLLPTDLRELPQTRQLLIREHPRCHDPQPPTRRPTLSAEAKHQPHGPAARTENPYRPGAMRTSLVCAITTGIPSSRTHPAAFLRLATAWSSNSTTGGRSPPVRLGREHVRTSCGDRRERDTLVDPALPLTGLNETA